MSPPPSSRSSSRWPWGAGADLHAGDSAGQPAAQVVGDLDVGARALRRGDEGHLDFAGGGVVGVVARGADADDGALHLGDGGVDEVLHEARLAVDEGELRADGHLAGDAHLAFVAGREELGADARGEEQAADGQRRGQQDGEGPGPQGVAQHAAVERLDALLGPQGNGEERAGDSRGAAGRSAEQP